jgi:hypothetical protein
MKTIAAALLAATAYVGLAASQELRVTFYEHENYQGASKTFIAPWRSTCYNIHDCFNDRATSIKWTSSSAFPEIGMLVFYADGDCKGGKMNDRVDDARRTEIPNVGAAMNDRISSFATYTQPSGITGYTGYKCSARLGGNETEAAFPAIPLAPNSGVL